MSSPGHNPDEQEEDFDLPWLEEGGDGYDPELAKLPKKVNWMRPILMVAIIAFSGLVLSKFQGELEYFFSGDQAVDLGDTVDFALKAQQDPTWKPDLPHDKFVRLRGFPRIRGMAFTCSTQHRYFRLVGSQVYVRAPFEEEMSPLECKKMKTTKASDWPMYQEFNGTGRMLSFRSNDRGVRALRTYYEQQFRTHFCGTLTEEQQQQRIKEIRDQEITYFKAQHRRAPTEEELGQLLDGVDKCEDGYVLLAGEDPMSSWPYAAASAFLVLISLFNLVMLVRWFLQLRR